MGKKMTTYDVNFCSGNPIILGTLIFHVVFFVTFLNPPPPRYNPTERGSSTPPFLLVGFHLSSDHFTHLYGRCQYKKVPLNNDKKKKVPVLLFTVFVWGWETTQLYGDYNKPL